VHSSIDQIKQQKRGIIARYTTPDNRKALTQVVTTLLPLAALWVAAFYSPSVWLTTGVALLMTLFLLRAFVMMHDCGHGSMFRTARLNKAFGFVFGVVSGMPQYVWSKHHAYHHSTNGNWAKYRGPLAIASVDEFALLTERQQRANARSRHIALAPLAGFVYLIFNPRMTWLKGSLQLAAHLIKGKIAQPSVPFKAHAAEFETRYWASSEEYWHMTWNNVVLLSWWVVMSVLLGPVLFFSVYLTSMSLAGAGGIVLFTVQHNFKHSYATGDEGWDYDTAAIEGTSFLVLPGWLNWFTADIAYHHVHHLSAQIPNYRLAQCHNEYAQLFSDVTRIRLREIPASLKYILWDTRARQLITVAEYRQQDTPAT
jgi:acyl-lipid omega-6 desaturase (Delta-12 desaturase)